MSELKKYWADRLYETEEAATEQQPFLVMSRKDVYLAADIERVIAELVSALRALHDVQNGSPLPKYDRDWKAAMEDTERLLAEWETKP